MSVFDGWDSFRECISCGNQFDASHPRYGPNAMECRDCEMGLTPEPAKPLYEKLAEAYRVKTELGEEAFDPSKSKKEVA